VTRKVIETSFANLVIQQLFPLNLDNRHSNVTTNATMISGIWK